MARPICRERWRPSSCLPPRSDTWRLKSYTLSHMFGKDEQGLDVLVDRFGSQEAVVEQLHRGLSAELPTSGVFSTTRETGGRAVTSAVDGVPGLEAYIKP